MAHAPHEESPSSSTGCHFQSNYSDQTSLHVQCDRTSALAIGITKEKVRWNYLPITIKFLSSHLSILKTNTYLENIKSMYDYVANSWFMPERGIWSIQREIWWNIGQAETLKVIFWAVKWEKLQLLSPTPWQVSEGELNKVVGPCWNTKWPFLGRMISFVASVVLEGREITVGSMSIGKEKMFLEQFPSYPAQFFGFSKFVSFCQIFVVLPSSAAAVEWSPRLCKPSKINKWPKLQYSEINLGHFADFTSLLNLKLGLQLGNNASPTLIPCLFLRWNGHGSQEEVGNR